MLIYIENIKDLLMQMRKIIEDITENNWLKLGFTYRLYS